MPEYANLGRNRQDKTIFSAEYRREQDKDTD